MPVRKKKYCMKSLLVNVWPPRISCTHSAILSAEEDDAEAGGDERSADATAS